LGESEISDVKQLLDASEKHIEALEKRNETLDKHLEELKDT